MRHGMRPAHDEQLMGTTIALCGLVLVTLLGVTPPINCNALPQRSAALNGSWDTIPIDDACDERNHREFAMFAPRHEPLVYIIAWHSISNSRDMCALTIDRIAGKDEPYVLIGEHRDRAEPGGALALDARQHFWTITNGKYIQLDGPDQSLPGEPGKEVTAQIESQLSLQGNGLDSLENPDGTKWYSEYNGVREVDRNGSLLADVLVKAPACPKSITNPRGGFPVLKIVTRDGSLWFMSMLYSVPYRTVYRLWRLSAQHKLNYVDLPPDSYLEAIGSAPDDMIWLSGTLHGKPAVYVFTITSGDSTLDTVP